MARVEECTVDIQELISCKNKRFKGVNERTADSSADFMQLALVEQDASKLKTKLINAYIDEVQ